MFIQPMQGIESINGAGAIGGVKGTTSGAGDIFKGIFQDSITNVQESEAAVAADALALAAGEVDDLHTLGINQSKAQLSISLMVQLRNRFLDSYNELMRINL